MLLVWHTDCNISDSFTMSATDTKIGRFCFLTGPTMTVLPHKNTSIIWVGKKIMVIKRRPVMSSL